MSAINIQSKNDDQPLQNFKQKLRKILQLEKEKSINKTVIKNIDLNQDDLEKLNLQDPAKALIFKNCNTIQEFLEVFQKEKIKNFLRNSSHCFVVNGNIKKPGLISPEDFLLHFEAENLKKKPLIIQLNIESLKRQKIFFKGFDENDLEVFEEGKEKFEEKDLITNLSSTESFDFKCLLKALKSRFVGSFDGDILSCTINEEKKVQGTAIIDQFIKKDNALVVRFLKLFSINEITKISLKTAAVYAGPNTIAALLDLPFDNKQTHQLESSVTKILKSTFIDGQNLLCIAAENGKPETVDFLVKLGIFNQNSDEALKASNAAFRGKKLENLSLLLMRDFPFPGKFVEALKNAELEKLESESNETSEKHQKDVKALKEIYKTRENLFQSIENNERTGIEKFVEENPEIRKAFNCSNEPALQVALVQALESKSFKIYALLLYHRFEANDSFKYQNLLYSLTRKQKEQITIACQAYYGRPVDSHIFFIYSKTRLGLGYDKKKQKSHFESIKTFLDKLNKLPEVVPILKVIEHSYSLIVVFDFDRDNVNKIDLVSSENFSGFCYQISGRIYIGAKTSEKEVLATLVHELSHYAMKILFGNSSKPHFKEDLAVEKKFQEIINECQSLKTNVPIVERVFQFYKKQDFSAELIVRIPEMIVFYHESQKLLEQVLKIYKNLYEFYKEKVLQEIEEFTQNPATFQATRDVQQLNERLGNLREFTEIKLKPLDVNFVDKNNEEIQDNVEVETILSKIPDFTISNLVEKFKKGKTTREISGNLIIFSSRDLRNDFHLQSIFSTCHQNENLTFIMNVDEKISEKAWKILTDKISNEIRMKIIFVCSEKSLVELIKEKFLFASIKEQEISYKWSDITEETKVELLKTKVKFQGEEILLNEIVGLNSKTLNHLPLAKLLKGNLDEIANKIKVSPGYQMNYFIERSLYNKNSLNTEEKIFESFLENSQNKKVLLISDEAGMGKSTILSHVGRKLKKMSPDHWIIRINLHEYVEAFKSEENQNFDEVFKFIAENFEKLKNDFEISLLKELFEKGKVILLLDGLDEISPYYNDQFIRFFRKLLKSAIKQVWLTMRPYLKDKLEIEANETAWELKPFSVENQVNFMTKYWSYQLKVESTFDLETCAKELIRNVTESIEKDSLNLVGIPLQARMIADIFMDDVKKILKNDTIKFEMPQNFDLLCLYKEFMTRKIKITISEKGETVGIEKARNEVDSVDMMEVHEKLAVTSVYLINQEKIGSESQSTNLKLDPDCYEIEISDDQLQRYGLVSIDSCGKPRFLHQTFAEYFVAMFVFKIISKSNFFLLSEALKLVAFIGEGRHEIIISFLESSIKQSRRTQDNEKLHKSVAKHLEHKLKIKNFAFLSFFTLTDKTFLMNFFLKSLEHGSQEFIKSFLFYKQFERIIHVAACRGNKVIIEHIWKLVESNLEETEVKKYFKMQIGSLNVFDIIFHRFFVSQNDMMVQCLSFDEIRDKFSDKNDVRAFHKAPEKASEFFFENSILSKLFEAAKKLFNAKELNNLAHNVFKIEDCQIYFGESSLNRREKLTSEFSRKYFRFVLDQRWKIVKEVSEVNDDGKLMMEQNLFTNFIVLTLNQTQSKDDDRHILEIFKWILENFESKEVVHHCIKNYFMASLKKLKLSQTAREILKIVKSILSDEEFCQFLQNEENIFEQTSSFRDNNLTVAIKVFSEVFTKTELKSIILNNNTVFGSNMLINVMAAHDCPSAVQSTLLEIIEEK